MWRPGISPRPLLPHLSLMVGFAGWAFAPLRAIVMWHGFAPPLAEIPWLPAFGTSA